MSTSRIHMEQLALAQISYDAIDASIRSLDMEEEQGNALIAGPGSRLEQLAKIYRAVKPLLKAIAILPLLPPAWRAVLQLFLTTFDEVDSGFKAGKDLEPQS